MKEDWNLGRARAAAVALASTCLCACGADPSTTSEDTSSGPGKPAEGALTIQLPGSAGNVEKAAKWFDMDAATFNSRELFYVQDWLCFLSKIGGEIEDSGGQMLYPSKTSRGDVYWFLYTETNARTRVICTQWTNFTAAGSIAADLSPETSIPVTTGTSGSDYVDMWGGNSATAISGIDASAMNGYGEYALIRQSTDPTTPSRLEVRTKAGILGIFKAYIEGWGQSVFFGNRSLRKLVNLVGYSGANGTGSLRLGNAASSGTFEFNVSTTSGFQSYWMSATNQGICYFTNISGEFDGGGEYARISENGSQWFLASAAGGGEVKASARCMAYYQTTAS
jgi:hypothetical protein